jgi:hypothetical protein
VHTRRTALPNSFIISDSMNSNTTPSDRCRWSNVTTHSSELSCNRVHHQIPPSIRILFPDSVNFICQSQSPIQPLSPMILICILPRCESCDAPVIQYRFKSASVPWKVYSQDTPLSLIPNSYTPTSFSRLSSSIQYTLSRTFSEIQQLSSTYSASKWHFNQCFSSFRPPFLPSVY